MQQYIGSHRDSSRNCQGERAVPIGGTFYTYIINWAASRLSIILPHRHPQVAPDLFLRFTLCFSTSTSSSSYFPLPVFRVQSVFDEVARNSAHFSLSVHAEITPETLAKTEFVQPTYQPPTNTPVSSACYEHSAMSPRMPSVNLSTPEIFHRPYPSLRSPSSTLSLNDNKRATPLLPMGSTDNLPGIMVTPASTVVEKEPTVLGMPLKYVS